MTSLFYSSFLLQVLIILPSSAYVDIGVIMDIVAYQFRNITELTDDLNADGDESVIVTLMPRQGMVKIRGAQVELS